MEEFFTAAAEYIVETTVIANYANGTDESRRKYRELLTIRLCLMYSPRKNYDISKDTIRHFVGNVLEREVEWYESTQS
jgi:hypothetical protein